MSSSPEALGFEAERLAAVGTVVEQGVKDNLYPAAVYAVVRHGMLAASGEYGLIQPDTNPALKTDFNTVFDMASLTKTITATLLLMAVERGELQLGQSVGYLIPEAEKTAVADCTLRQLATHSSGLPPWKPLYKTTHPTPLDDILSTSLDNVPGTHYAYSDLGYILIGEILTRVCSQPLDRFPPVIPHSSFSRTHEHPRNPFIPPRNQSHAARLRRTRQGSADCAAAAGRGNHCRRPL